MLTSHFESKTNIRNSNSKRELQLHRATHNELSLGRLVTNVESERHFSPRSCNVENIEIIRRG